MASLGCVRTPEHRRHSTMHPCPPRRALQTRVMSSGFLMSYHAAGRTWLDSDGLHLAQSADGLNFEPMHGPDKCATAYPLQGFGVSLFLRPQIGRCSFLANARAYEPAAERGRKAWAPFKALLANSTHCTDGRLLRGR